LELQCSGGNQNKMIGNFAQKQRSIRENMIKIFINFFSLSYL